MAQQTIFEQKLNAFEQYLKYHSLFTEKKDISNGKQIVVKDNINSAFINIYNNGTVVISGKDSNLKSILEELKNKIGENKADEILKDSNKALNDLKNKGVDEIILKYMEEGLKCLNQKCIFASSVLFGAVSERGIQLLGEAYYSLQKDNKAQERLAKFKKSNISTSFEILLNNLSQDQKVNSEFKDYKSKLEQVFHFYRLARNDVVHPKDIPELNTNSQLFALGALMQYITFITKMISEFKSWNINSTSSSQN